MDTPLLSVSNTSRNEVDDVIIEGSHGGPYMVEKIVGIFMGKDKKKYYRVKWIDSWEPEENLSEACQTLIDEFWNGTTLDQTGAVVRKGDLKQGLKVIKKEISSSSENLTTSQPNQPSSTSEKHPEKQNSHEASMPTPDNQKAKTNSVSVPAENRSIIKHDPSANESKTTNTKESMVSAAPASINLFPGSVRQNTDQLEQNSGSSVKEPSTSIKKQLRFSESMSLPCGEANSSVSVASQTTQKGLDERDKPVAHSHEQQQQETVNVLVRGENVNGMYIDHSRVMYSSPPTACCDDELTCVGRPVALNFDCTADEGSVNEADDTDYASPIENIIDVESEDDDVEITVAIESPVSRKRQSTTRQTGICLTPTSQTKRRRGRPPARPISQSPTENVPTMMPLHPRCQLRQTTPKKTVGNLNSPSRQQGITSFVTTSPSKRFYASQGPTVQPPSEATIHQENSNVDVSPQRRLNASRNPSFVPTSTQTSYGANVVNKSPQFSRQCNICNLSFLNVTLARQHAKVKHTSSVNTPVESNLHSCSICKGLFRTNRDLKSHMLLHGEHSLYKCEVCSKVFKQRSALSQHMLIHSEELPFSCEICHKRFRQQAHLILHMGKHGQNNEGVYTCPHCLHDFHDQAQFSLHMKEHDADLPFCCNLCKERFKLKSDLLMHLDGHNEGRPFTCHICKKSFKTKTYLYGHMQMHKVRSNNPQNADSTTTSTVAMEMREENVCIKKQPLN